VANFLPLAAGQLARPDPRFVAGARAAAQAVPPNQWEDGDAHYATGHPARGWDFWARSGLLEAELVQRVDQVFLDYLVRYEDAWWRRSEDKPVFAHNRHHVYGTWGYWLMACLLERRLLPAEREGELGRYLAARRTECERWFRAAGRDEPRILSAGIFHNADTYFLVAAMTGDVEFFSSGYARRFAEMAAGILDNTGAGLGTGGYEDTYRGANAAGYPISLPVVLSTFYYRDPQLRWLRDHQKGFNLSTWWARISPAHGWTTAKVAPEPPQRLLGVQSLLGPPGRPFFITVREGFDPADLYIGLTGTGQPDMDSSDAGKERQVLPNMIARMSWGGVSWLATNTNRHTAFHRSALTVDADGEPAETLGDTKVLLAERQDDAIFYRGSVEDYGPCAWERSFIILGRRFWLVEDRITAARAATYSGVLTWLLAKPTELRDSRSAEAAWDGQRLSITTAEPNVYLDLAISPPERSALTHYVLRLYQSGPLARGEGRSLHTLFALCSGEGPAGLDVRPAGGRTVLIRDGATGEIYLAGIGGLDRGELKIAAEAFLLAPGRCYLAGQDARGLFGSRPLTRGRTPDGLAETLAGWWKDSAGRPAAPVPAVEAGEPLWEFTDFARTPKKLTGFAVDCGRAAQPNAPFQDDIVRSAAAAWPKGETINFTATFRRPVHLREIRLINSYSDNASLYHAGPRDNASVVVTQLDGDPPRAVPATFRPYARLEEVYKANGTAYRGWTAAVDVEGRRFRIEMNGSSLIHAELRGDGDEPDTVADVQAASLRAGGTYDVLVRTKGSEIICLDGRTGQLVWRRAAPAPVLAWVVGDADGDGKDEIALSCMDEKVYRLAADGTVLWGCPVSRTKHTLGYALDIWAGDGRETGFVVSSYYRMHLIGLDGKPILDQTRIIPGMWLYDCFGGRIDLNGDGVCDAISRALWGHVNLFDGKTKKVDYFANLRGGLVRWEVLTGANGRGPQLLVASENGLGLYDAAIREERLTDGWDEAPDEDALLIEPRSKRARWEHHFLSPVAAMVRWPAAHAILWAHPTGVIGRVGPDGKRLPNILVADRLIDLAPAPSAAGERLVANTGRELIFLDPELKATSRLPIANDGMRILPGGREAILWRNTGQLMKTALEK